MAAVSLVDSINKAKANKLAQVDTDEWLLITETLKNFNNGITTESPWIKASAEEVKNALKIAADSLESTKVQSTNDKALQEALIKIREDFPDSLIHQATVLKYVSQDLQLLNEKPATLEH